MEGKNKSNELNPPIDTRDVLPQDEAGLVLESFRTVDSSSGTENYVMKVAAAGGW